jgi:hypothetical protein
MMGQIFAVSVTLFFIGGGLFLFYYDKDGAAWASMGAGLAAVIAAFSAFNKSHSEPQKDKNDQS